MAENRQDVEQSDGVNFGQGNKARLHDVVGHDQYNRRGGADANVNVNVGNEQRQRGESSQSWIERALAGDSFTGAPGLIKEMRDLNARFSEFVHKDEEWKRNFFESSRSWAGKQVAIAWLAFGLLAITIAFYLVGVGSV